MENTWGYYTQRNMVRRLASLVGNTVLELEILQNGGHSGVRWQWILGWIFQMLSCFDSLVDWRREWGEGGWIFYFVLLSINTSQATCFLESSIQPVIHDTILIIVRLWWIEAIKRGCYWKGRRNMEHPHLLLLWGQKALETHKGRWLKFEHESVKWQK